MVTDDRHYAVQDDERSLQYARVSLLQSTFKQLWTDSESSSLIERKPSSPSNTATSSAFTNAVNKPPYVSSAWIKPMLIVTILSLLLPSIPFVIRSQRRVHRYRYQCSSLACVSASHRILENLDTNVDPCEDFFTYACGGWLEHHFLVPSETSESYFKEIYEKNLIVLYELLRDNATRAFAATEKLRTFLNSCLDRSSDEKNARETLITLLSKIGHAPMLFHNWSADQFNLVSSLAFAHQYKIDPLFRTSVTVDESNNRYYRIHLQPSGLSFKHPSHYDDQNLRQLFTHIGAKLIRSLAPSSTSRREIVQQMQEIFLFERRLSHIVQRRESSNPLTSSHHRTYAQLHPWFSSWLDLEGYLQRIFHKDRAFFLNQTILISTPDYFEHLTALLRTTPTHTLANYISFQAIQELLPYMPERFNRMQRLLRVHLKGVTEEKPWWEVCVKRTDEAFGFATGTHE